MFDEEHGEGFLWYESHRTGRRVRAEFRYVGSRDGFHVALLDERGAPLAVVGAPRGAMDATDYLFDVLAEGVGRAELDLAS